jgi:DNA-binding NarL/FixJ family response regulator
MASDSSFGRLSQAWHASGGGKALSAARRGIDLLARSAGLSLRPDQDYVLWITNPGESPPPAAVTSLAGTRRNFRIEHLVPGMSDDIEALLRDRYPRLLVADVDWCAQIGLAAVRRLHRHRPAIDWLLCWDSPSPRWLETLVHSGARGVVLRCADETALARAFDAVVAGELWLSRQVLQWLYVTIVEAPGTEHDSTAPSSSSSSWFADSDLTPREHDVADLMRQGLTNREIAMRLGVSVNTVKKHLAHTYEKHGIRSRRQARSDGSDRV